jgi:hypothetical protein
MRKIMRRVTGVFRSVRLLSSCGVDLLPWHRSPPLPWCLLLSCGWSMSLFIYLALRLASSFCSLGPTRIHIHCFHCAHRNWESRPPERLPSSSSSAWVKGGNHVFLRVSLAARLLASSSTSWRIAGDRHGFSSVLHRAGRPH